MSGPQPNRVMLTYAEAAQRTRCVADELLERLLRSGVPAFARIPFHVETFAHLGKIRQAWQPEELTARLRFIPGAFSRGRSDFLGARMDRKMPSGQLVRIDESTLKDILRFGSAKVSRFSEMVILSGDTIRKVSPRESFPELSTAALFIRDRWFVTASSDDDRSADVLLETDISLTQSDLWIEPDSLPKLSAAREVVQFGAVLLGRWASRRLIELNEASHMIFSDNTWSNTKEAKVEVKK